MHNVKYGCERGAESRTGYIYLILLCNLSKFMQINELSIYRVYLLTIFLYCEIKACNFVMSKMITIIYVKLSSCASLYCSPCSHFNEGLNMTLSWSALL